MFQYQILFLTNFLVCLLVMKALSWILTPKTERPPLPSFLFLTPYLSTRSERYSSPVRHYSLMANLLMYLTLMGLFLVAGHEYLSPFSYIDVILISPAIYFFTEACGALGQLLYAWKSREIFPIHHHPLSSPNLSQFWGRRWNLWVQDWLKDISAALPRRSRAFRIGLTFLVSGIFHEFMVNLPYWIKTGESYFGSMLGYFLIQALGLFIDKRFLKHRFPTFRRVYLWMLVALPSPLFINTPLLAFFGVE